MVVVVVITDTRLPTSQPPAAQPYQQPRQQHQLYVEPHYAVPRSSQHAVQKAPPANQRELQYDRQQPGYRPYDKSQPEMPHYVESRAYGQPQPSWQEPHPAYGRQHYDQHQEPVYSQQQPRHEPQYQQQQPLYAARAYHQTEPQYGQQQQAPYQHGRVPSAIDPSYTEPQVTHNGRIATSRSKSASDLNQPEASGAWPMHPGPGRQPPLSSQEPLSSWKSYGGAGPGQRGLASGVDMQEPVRVDWRRPETMGDGRHFRPDARQYAEQWAGPTARDGMMPGQVPHQPELDRRSQPQLNVTKQQSPSTYSSHPELSSGAHQFVEPSSGTAPYTSGDMLRRAQPSRQDGSMRTPFTQHAPPSASAGHGAPERRSIPVGGHLRAIDPKNLQPLAPVVPPSTSERSRPHSHYYKPTSHASGPAAESTYAKPASRSQSLPRAVQPPAGAWERAKKEEALKRDELEQKRCREDEIRQLESQPPDELSPAEIDRLRRLKLNAEFDRRATELERSGDQTADTDVDMTPAVSFLVCPTFTNVVVLYCSVSE